MTEFEEALAEALSERDSRDITFEQKIKFLLELDEPIYCNNKDISIERVMTHAIQNDNHLSQYIGITKYFKNFFKVYKAKEFGPAEAAQILLLCSHNSVD
jgi:hypothetical protein